MSVRSSIRYLLAGGLALALAGCGHGEVPHPSRLPLVPGAHVIKRVRVCDTGANPYCAIDTVVVDKQYRGGPALLTAELGHLKALGWMIQMGENIDEMTALSPGTNLRLILGAAPEELQAIDLRRVKGRPQALALALAKTMFDRVPAMAIIVEAGPR